RMADAQHIALMHHDPLRVTAQRPAGLVGNGRVVGADHAVAVVLQPGLAILAVPATADGAADPHQIAHLIPRHLRAARTHAADDFMARHTGESGAGPFGTYLVQVRVADAAIEDVDLHIMRARRAAGDLHGFERLGAG